MELAEVNGKIVELGGPKPFVEFYEHPKKVGIGQYETVIFIKIKPKGCRDFMSRPATDEDKRDYADAWAMFQKGVTPEEGRTPLGQLPSFKTAFKLELEAKYGVECVEDLAAREQPPENYLVPIWRDARNYIKLLEMQNDELGQEV